MSEFKFAGLDLVEADAPRRMAIVHPVNKTIMRDAEDREAYIELHSMDSKIAKRWIEASRTRRLDPRTRDEIADGVELLVALTVGWYLVDGDGKPLDQPFSPEAARDLYTKFLWMREQANIFALERGNFSKASSTT